MKDAKIKCNSVEEADAVLQMIEDRYPEVRWYSGNKPTEWKPYDSDTKDDAKIYFDVDHDCIGYSISTTEWHKDCDWANATSAKRFLRKSNTAIYIYQRGRMVIAHESQTGREAVAKCSPSDTFDFNTGASIALARLIAKTHDALNHDVKAEWIKVLGLTPVKKRVFTDADRNFKVGDRVVVRDWDDMEKEYGANEVGTIHCRFGFSTEMRHLCGRTATVTNTNNGRIGVDFDDKSGDTAWSYSSDMFNPTDIPAPEKEKPEAKFKVGDFVTLKEDVKADKWYGGLELLSGAMYDNAYNKRMTVVRVDWSDDSNTYFCECKGDSRFTTFHYSEEMLDKWDESKIHEGDTVKVVNTGLNYSSYVQWVGKHISDPYMAARFCFGSPSTDKNYKVIKIAKHEKNGRDLAFIEECDGLAYNKCYLIEVKGLEKA